MIKINLLKDHSTPVEKKQPSINTKKIPLIGYVYIVAILVIAGALGYLWNTSGNAIRAATIESQRLESDLKSMENLRKQFLDFERKKQERQGKVDTINKLLESQKGPVRLLNAIIQSIPQNRDIWLTALEQTSTGVKIKGETRTSEVLPTFMEDLKKSGIFTGIDVEHIERRNEIYNFSILCVGGK